MADPIVTITNGVPTSSVPASGTITTLGMTLADGANATLGAVADAAASGAGTINAHLRSIATSVGGTLTVTGTVATSGTTTVTGTVTANQGSAGGVGWKVEGLTTNASSALSTSATNVPSTSFNYGFNGTTWDQLQVDGSKNLKVAIVPALPAGGNVIGGVTQSGTWNVGVTGTATVSGTVTVTQGTAANLNATVTGTVAATQSGTWNITNISGTVSLPTGAATAANQPTAATLGSTTLGQTGNVSLGAVTTAAPTYTTATSNALSLTTAGALRIDGSGVTQPISGNIGVTGTVAVTQSGTWNITNISGTVSLPTGAATSANQPTNAAQGSTTSGQTGTLGLGAVTTAAPTYTTGQTSPFSLDTTGALRVNVTSGGGTGGTSSTFGAAFPGTGTAIGAKDSTGTNMAALNLDASGNLKVAVTGAGSGGTSAVDEAAFTAGTSAFTPTGGFFQTTATNNALTTGQFGNFQVTANRALFTNLRNAAGTEIGTSGAPLRTDPTGTTTQPVSGTVTVTQGTAANLNTTVTGTVAATQSGTWTVQPGNTANTTAWLVTGTGGTFPVTGTVTANQGGAPWSATVASATAPVSTMNSASATGGVASAMSAVFDDVTPTAITENNFGYVRMSANRNQYMTLRDAAGNERGANITAANALVVDGSAVTQPVSGTVAISGTVAATQSGTWTVQPGNTANTTPWLTTINQGGNSATVSAGGRLAVDGSGVTQPVSGTVAATQSGNWTSRIVGNAGATLDAVIGNATAPTNMLAVGGVFNTTRPTLTTGQSAAFQSNSSGVQLVDGSTVTQPVSGTVTVTQGTAANLNATVTGTVAATQSGTWNITNISGTVSLPTGASTSANQPSNAGQGSTTSGQTGTLAMGAVTTGNPTYTTAQTSPLSLDTSGALRVNVIAGSGGGGTSSSFGSAFPATGTAIGAKDNAGTNMTFLQVNASNALKVDGSAVTQPVSGTVTAAQATAANLNATVVGTGTFAVQAAQSGTWGVNLGANVSSGAAWTSATGLNTAVTITNSNTISYDTFVGQITQTTTLTAGAVTFEESYDGGTNWKVIPAGRFLDPSTGNALSNPYTFVATVNQPWQVIGGSVTQVRARLSTVITGTGSVTINFTTTQAPGPANVFQSVPGMLQMTASQFGVWTMTGDVPSGNTDSGNPNKIGGVGRTTNPTAVSDGQRVNAIFDKLGKQVVVGAVRDLKGKQKTTITSSTTETTIVTAGAAGVFRDLYGLTLANTSATACNVTVKDSTAGTTQMILAVPAGETRGFMLPVDSAVPQTTAANNWTATCSASVASMEITALVVNNT